ncbi:MAG: hypothetical protein GF372_07520 [Candidatus Marinimicrobia bacterium]|nr:hypothetical protein [Candidatus Neomarinimicrobiota bacterium]
MKEYPGEALRFTADLMLKRLAKYLRALGYNTLFDEQLTDAEMRDISVAQNRILLTRDEDLYNQTPELHALHVTSQHPLEQFSEVAAQYPVTFNESRFMSRCLECNSLLVEMNLGDVKEDVPPRVYERQDQFFKCEQCDQLFWSGDHVKRLRKKLRAVLD